MMRRGMLFVDNIWDGGGSGDTADDLLRDAVRFLDSGIIDDDDDESIAVLERAVLTQASAYAVNTRIAGLCGTTLGVAVSAVAGGSGRALPVRGLPAVRGPDGGVRVEIVGVVVLHLRCCYTVWC